VKSLGSTENQEEEQTQSEMVHKRPKIVWKPREEEIVKHNLTHIPFRNWCPHCIRGRAVNDPHPHIKTGPESEIPTISIDYFWMIENEKEEGAEQIPGGKRKKRDRRSLS
jgi:hypothetical protein